METQSFDLALGKKVLDMLRNSYARVQATDDELRIVALSEALEWKNILHPAFFMRVNPNPTESYLQSGAEWLPDFFQREIVESQLQQAKQIITKMESPCVQILEQIEKNNLQETMKLVRSETKANMHTLIRPWAAHQRLVVCFALEELCKLMLLLQNKSPEWENVRAQAEHSGSFWDKIIHHSAYLAGADDAKRQFHQNWGTWFLDRLDVWTVSSALYALYGQTPKI